ncbi:LADA_0G10946g1_1 [Lachancea dasiensis]|uniref:LADA_0G10946g1_1 n=1 Tax=Lachancea dasiensis TaxID=1072105 RepID=A0A1G4JV37_9SACH|nr:LADA_0G10946g1_1 [Lachancea dasiensis]
MTESTRIIITNRKLLSLAREMEADLNGQFGTSLLLGTHERPSLSFRSSDGKTVMLQRKKGNRLHDISWRHDEAYGIDINRLLDQCGNIRNHVREGTRSREGVSGKLWTEKWRPNNFFDLVGNEKTNRRVLKWLRQWSPLVFGEVLPKRSSGSWRPTTNGLAGSAELLDPLQRPHKKILLINGPPGIGKTSVAHVVAKQAGYAAIEINASDERAGPNIKERIHNALFSNTIEERPVCLIADEVDGSMETGFVKILVDILNNDYKATQRLLSGGSAKSKSGRHRRKKREQVVVRPVIAICNNIYASALEKLRPHCEIVTFQRPSESAIIERLFHVSKKERIPLTKKALKELTDLSQGDVRSCLNNMQFMSTSKLDATAATFEEQVKDITVSWYKICNQIFQKNPHIETRRQFNKLLRDIETNSSYQKIVHGCYTIYPSVKYSDHGLQKPSIAADWLYFNDRMFKSMFEHNGELIRYNSAVPLAFFYLFSDIANKDDVRMLNNEFELREMQQRNADIVMTTMQRASPGSQIFMTKDALTLEILPLLDYILAADFSKVRNVSTKNTLLDSIVLAIIKFNLSFGERIDTDLPRVTCIEPPFDKVIIMDEKRAKEVLSKRPALLNIIVAKVQENKLKRRAIEVARADKEDLESARKMQRLSTSKSTDFFRSQYANVLTKTSTPSSEQKMGVTSTQEPIKIWVKYKEGFSDAVRKNVTWRSLWE